MWKKYRMEEKKLSKELWNIQTSNCGQMYCLFSGDLFLAAGFFDRDGELVGGLI